MPITDGEMARAPAGLPRPLRILLCPDQPEWAFHNIARNIIRHAPEWMDISLHFMGRSGERDLSVLFETMFLKNVDLVHIFWREDLFEILRPQTLVHVADRLRLEPEELVEMIASRAFTTSVYDHLHSSDQSLSERWPSFHLTDGYTVSSAKLHALYSARTMVPRPDAVTPDGVDLGFFNPGPARTPRKTLTVGWVGNSGWGKSSGDDPKGYFRLFRPALDILKDRGVAVTEKLADPQVRRIPFEEMPDFYRQIDMLACTSASEGTPNPVLEAMATGVGVVSTDVGIVQEAFGPRQSAFILRQADPAAFADAMELLARDRDLLAELGRENLERIEAWSWEKVVGRWWPFWLTARARAADPRMATRRQQALHQTIEAYFGYLQNQPADNAKMPRFLRGFARLRKPS